MQLAMSIALIVAGLYLALIADAGGDVRTFGWVVVGFGVLGLALRFWLRRQ
jgi:hypothetical protein